MVHKKTDHYSRRNLNNFSNALNIMFNVYRSPTKIRPEVIDQNFFYFYLPHIYNDTFRYNNNINIYFIDVYPMKPCIDNRTKNIKQNKFLFQRVCHLIKQGKSVTTKSAFAFCENLCYNIHICVVLKMIYCSTVNAFRGC